MTDTHTYWATIGRNVNLGGPPLLSTEWEAFRTRLRNDVTVACGGEILSSIVGRSSWDGEEEETYALLFTIGADYVAPLRHRLSGLARTYHQDAIGFVGGHGTDTLVEAS